MFFSLSQQINKTYEYIDEYNTKSSNYNISNCFENQGGSDYIKNQNETNKSSIYSNATNNVIKEQNDSKAFELLKQYYLDRITKLYTDMEVFKNKVSTINIGQIMNQQIFIEKENEISNLLEKNSKLISESNKLKFDNERLQKIISVLEIDLKQYEKQYYKIIQSNNQLKEENTELLIKIQNYYGEKSEKEQFESMLINYQNEINELKKEVEKKEKQIKQINSNVNKYNIEKFNYINEKNKKLIEIQTKHSILKKDFLNFKKEIIKQIKEFQSSNYKDSIDIITKLKEKINFLQNRDFNKKLEEQFQLIEKSQKENKKLIAQNENDLQKINELQTQQSTLEKENKTLKNQIIKLNLEIEVLNEAINKQKTTLTITSNQKSEITDLINQLKRKYDQQIDLLKNHLSQQQTTQKKEEELLQIIKEKDIKIAQLETALNQSIISLSSGIENVKLAKKLDDEVKEIFALS